MKLNRTTLRAVQILKLVSKRPEGITLDEICEELGLPKTSAYDIVITLVETGMIHVSRGQKQQYRIGLTAYRIGINYTNNLQLYITRALNPAKIKNIEIDEAHKKANVYLDPEEVSLAIGKGGLNIKLASQLTGYDIDVYRELDQAQEEDVNLDEFADEIEGWVIDELKRVGCDTAKSVLELSESELESRTDLEIETIREVLNILKAEFE